MAKIAIVKVRSAHDVEWELPPRAGRMLDFVGLRQLRRHLEATSGQAFMPQLTLPYLAALGQRYNERQGRSHRFVLIDDHEAKIRLGGYEMVWFTSVSTTAPAVYRLSHRARRAGAVTVIGGIHATLLPDEAGLHADAIALGDGERIVGEILADFDAGAGLRPRYQGGRDTSLEQLPLPRWEDAQVRDYAPWVVPVQTSRGCRNACHFCSTTRFQGAARRHRPPQEIVDEIKALQERGVLTPEKVIFFTDNNIVSDTDHRRGVRDTRYARSLFEALIPLDVLWVGQGEIGVGDDRELTELMARAGCIKLLVGFESIDDKNLGSVGKHSNDVATYVRQIEMLHRYGISIIGCFIFGLDHDTPDVFARTREFIDRHIEVPQLSMLTPFPGTLQYRQMKREGRILHEDWSQYDITHGVYRPRAMSIDALEAGYRAIARHLYTYPNILRRALRHALRPTAYTHPQMSFKNRLTSVLAPNLVYRTLSSIGRKQDATLLQARRVARAA